MTAKTEQLPLAEAPREGPALPAVPTANNPYQLLSQAIASGLGVDTLRELNELRREVEADEARKAFARALCEFQANPPRILRSKAGLKTKSGEVVNHYAPLDQVLRAIRPSLRDCGLTARWEIEPDGEKSARVTFVLMHEQGFETRTSLLARPEGTDLANQTQRMGGGITFAKRYTLLAGLGLEQEGLDTDGQSQSDKLTNDEFDGYMAQIKELGMGEARLLDYLGLKTLADLTRAEVPKLMSAITARRRYLEEKRESEQ